MGSRTGYRRSDSDRTAAPAPRIAEAEFPDAKAPTIISAISIRHLCKPERRGRLRRRRHRAGEWHAGHREAGGPAGLHAAAPHAQRPSRRPGDRHPAAISAATGLPAAEAVRLLTRQWREGDIAALKVIADRLGLDMPLEGLGLPMREGRGL